MGKVRWPQWAEIYEADGFIALDGPYVPELPTRAKRLGGRWDPETKSWRFDVRNEGLVRAMVVELYGAVGEPVKLVDVHLQVAVWEEGRQAWFAGRCVATRGGRDTPVSLHPSCLLMSGGFPGRGGSVANPRLAGEGVVLLVRDVPANHSDLECPGVQILQTEQPVQELLSLEPAKHPDEVATGDPLSPQQRIELSQMITCLETLREEAISIPLDGPKVGGDLVPGLLAVQAWLDDWIDGLDADSPASSQGSEVSGVPPVVLDAPAAPRVAPTVSTARGKPRRGQEGHSALELVIVLAVISFLMALSLSGLSGLAGRAHTVVHQEQTQVSQEQLAINQILGMPGCGPNDMAACG